jgi:nucleotide-binding universal stress UspA family protein
MEMPMFKRILVAIDGSPTSTHALRTALGLARDGGVPLHVLHVIDDAAIAQTFDGTAYVSPQYVEGLLAGMREAGRKVLAKAEKAAAKDGCAVETVLVETRGRSVAHAILAYARKIRPDLLVLGTHGRRGLSRLVMGSDAEMVVRESPVPVLLVRGGMSSARKSLSKSAREPAAKQPVRREAPAVSTRRAARALPAVGPASR